MNRLVSGKLIDEWQGQNIPSNSKTIDHTIGSNCVVSNKSTDLRLKSYRSSARVYSLGMSFVRNLEAYKGEVRRDRKIKATYDLSWAVEDRKARRILAWFVPVVLPKEHEMAIERVIREAKVLQIEVQIYRVAE